MCEVINSVLDYLIANYTLYMVVTMGVIISLTIGLLSLIKKPIKKLTSKISNEQLRKLANKVFIFCAFGISAGAWLLLKVVAPQYFAAEIIEMILTGAFSIVIYSLGDGVITKPSAQKLIEEIKDFDEQQKDNTTEKKVDPIKEFWKKVK